MNTKYHTIILSDLHLSDAEPIDPKRPLWKRFRRKKYFIDRSFSKFLDHMCEELKGKKIELILNGDIFDFDSVMSIPKRPNFSISNHENYHGLSSTEEKSAFKIKQILSDHDIWTQSLVNFINKGHKVVFVIGNHDVELNWHKVQDIIRNELKVSKENESNLLFCEWFYVSGEDTLVEHGNQYDPYCLCLDPINPLITKRGEYRMRLPFGNLANRFMINNMGLKNPHCDDAFLKTTMEFITFFYKYELRIQPFMLLTWFTGAIRTFIYSVVEGNLPSIKDPLTFPERVEGIAQRSNSTSAAVLTLKQNHAHPAIMRPLMLLRELWLDRAFLIMIIVWGCWQILTTSVLFADFSLWWFLVPLFIALPFFVYYAHGVQSDVHNNTRLALEKAPLSAKAVKVQRIVHGHTHHAQHKLIDNGIEYLNAGAWTPIFEDPECTRSKGQKLFVWINADKDREMKLFKWDDETISLSKESKKFLNL